MTPFWCLIISLGGQLKDNELRPKRNEIFEKFLRSQSVEERKKYVALVESVRDNGGVARIFSSLHVSGERKSVQ